MNFLDVTFRGVYQLFSTSARGLTRGRKGQAVLGKCPFYVALEMPINGRGPDPTRKKDIERSSLAGGSQKGNSVNLVFGRLARDARGISDHGELSLD